MNAMLGLLAAGFRLINRRVPWHRMPFFPAVLNLASLRHDLRARNLFGTQRSPGPEPLPGTDDPIDNRSADGSNNDLTQPRMGAAGMRFGRNVPIDQTFGETEPQLLDPNPRLISKELLTRREFKPVPHLNIAAAGWLQFMVHDWFSHGANALPTDDRIPAAQREPIRVPIPAGDSWHEDPMLVHRTHPSPEDRVPEDEGKPAAYRNVSTHWWDASQIYGSSKERQLWLRTESPVVEHAAAAVENGSLLPDGKLYLPNGHLPWFAMKRGNNASALLELSGEPGNGWLGLSMFHTIFAREHNHLCDALAREYPHRAQDGEWLFQKSRLIVAALLAKIHTVEWTPAILNTPELRFSMRANWWGIQGQRLVDGFGRFSKTELMGGIIESATDHHSAEYSITEEFNAVYCMYSLLPDRFALRRHGDDSGLFAGDRTFHDIAGGQVPLLYKEQGVSLADAFYSMGTEHPGLLKLNNFPTELQGLKKQAPSARTVDLGTIDILRDRERGVPRYCAFRRGLRMQVPKTFEELCERPEDAKRLREIYGRVEKVDLLVGCAAERWPAGFGFSDTAFQIFILMASRRLKSDRFYTTHFTPEVYTPFGLRWVRDNGMTSVLLRHLPELAPRLNGVKNAFFPWNRAG